ncbi:hypothetical protein ARMSODRAFT_1017801 [Armillaria solidipes]|uniref:CCHC-type domain-containing protein n=1 Tax=Armillaria solidipes TaxID=1076256 RepID=A0A2H3BJG4_9AGAR|nr:hypothetical protein ARMSODRAFT_1017801 [Armillaria solidipes]
MIANMGMFVPVGYNTWKEQIVLMNKERQCQKVYDSTHGASHPNWCNDGKSDNARASKGSSSMTTSLGDKKMATGTTYGSQGVPMDIDMMRKARECFQCGKKGHLSKNCLLQSWNKKKEEIRASTTEPTMGSKIEEVKDAAKNHSGWTYSISVVTPVIKYVPHSNIPALSTSKQTPIESHNRYAVLAISNVLDDKASTETESLASDLSTSLTDNHLTSSSLRVKVPGDKPPTIVVLIIMAAHRPDGAGDPGPNSPPEQAAPQAEDTTARKPIVIAPPQDLSNKSWD